jgi:tetrahydromethanopterin S-methyltransferase subunit A
MAIVSPLLSNIENELRAAMAAKKCWRCGCFQDTVTTLQNSQALHERFAPLLNEAQHLFEPQRYDCLGCEVCWPAIAMNFAGEIDTTMAEGSHCATALPEQRMGWPPLPGEYQVLRFQAPVAVCTLNSEHLIKPLCDRQATGLSIVGSLHTENLGIEHLIRNVLSNPHIRFLVICGEDTRKAIGHLPGQSLLALARHGVNNKMRIIDAKGKRPLLKNISAVQVEAFRQQVEVIDQIGNSDIDSLFALITATAKNDPGPFADAPADVHPVAIEVASEPAQLVLDPAGYFVVYPDRINQCLTLEHYSNQGVLDRILTATSATALYASAIQAQLISRLDHAAYLGRELTRAEHALHSGEVYVQDRAPGELALRSTSQQPQKQQPASACGCHAKEDGACH